MQNEISEHKHQTMLIEWFDLQYKQFSGRLYANANGGLRHIATAKKMKLEGVRAGVPDLCLPIPRKIYHCLYIEMKKKNGTVTPSQKDWIKFLNGQGNLAVVAYGFDEAREIINDYLL